MNTQDKAAQASQSNPIQRNNAVPQTTYRDLQPLIIHDPPRVIVISPAPDPWVRVQGITSMVIAVLAFGFALYSFRHTRRDKRREREAGLFRRLVSDFAESQLKALQDQASSLTEQIISECEAYNGNDLLEYSRQEVAEAIERFQAMHYGISKAIVNRLPAAERDRCLKHFDTIEDLTTQALNTLVGSSAPSVDTRRETRSALVQLEQNNYEILHIITDCEIARYAD